MNTLWDKGGPGTDPDILSFTVGDDNVLDSRLIPYDIKVSIAHVAGLEKIGILNKGEATELQNCLKGIYNEWREKKIKLESCDEDVHSAIEAALVERLGDLGKKVHTGKSRNDQILTDLRLLMKDSLLDTIKLLSGVVQAACNAGEKIGNVLMPGYTHTRRAMPSTVKFWYTSFADSWMDTLEWGRALYQRLNSSPLGSAAGFGVPLPLDREYTANLLGFDRVQINAASVQNSRGRHEIWLLSWFLDVARDIEKLSCDLICFSTAEYGFVKIPESFCTGSSIMPQKKNPDILELLRATPSVVRSCRDELEGIISKLSSGYHRDFQLTKAPLFRAIDKMRAVLPIVLKLLPSLKWDKGNLEKACDVQIFATHRAMELVKNGVSFRNAYLQAATELADSKTNSWRHDKYLIGEFSHIGAPGNPGIVEVVKRLDDINKWLKAFLLGL